MDDRKQPPPRSKGATIAVVVVVLVAIGLVGRLFGAGDDDASGGSAGQEISAGREAAPAAAVPANSGARMPDVVCMNLQAAQDLIQEHGVFYSRSEDATGKGRLQVMDRNWIVVSQRPAPGTAFGEGDAVLSVVKVDEPNSC